jgi:hypothetical protein
MSLSTLDAKVIDHVGRVKSRNQRPHISGERETTILIKNCVHCT